jgi:hypothetical protein
LYHSVHVELLKDECEWVPNFIGGAIPRSDRGDREYYCSTMLTFFKPWRTGKDLKSIEQTWDDAFSNYKFNPRHSEVMKYFNLRYECLDARDDYAAQMKKNNSINLFHNWEQYNDLEIPIDVTEKIKHDGENFECEFDAIDDDNIVGPKTQKRNNDMMKVEKMMHAAGWFDESPNGPANMGDLTPITPIHILPGKEWKTIVAKKKQEVIDARRKNIPSENTQSHNEHSDNHKLNDVKIVDKSYLKHNFKASNQNDQTLIDSTASEYLLNAEQNRAFRIIANHATQKNADQLKMYLGGMAGTGKSQVIKALIRYFTKRNESHRILVVAPTGNAAALIGGYTYHSILGINDRSSTSTSISNIRERLDGVDYMFLDEVSMLSCHDLYKIGVQLSKARNQPTVPFGGMNVIFAGDFAQLPPVNGGEACSLYSGCIGTQVYSGMTHYGQECAIGKAIWHQITTVVILRENMRQRNQSLEDVKFRTALENMRYKACTPDDINFLRTCVTGPGKDRPKLPDKNFRNVSIITAWNSQKDRINELGSARFAKESDQQLVDFYSIDKWVIYDDITEPKRKRRKRNNIAYNASIMTLSDQEKLWKLPHHATQHVPGKLSLCIGMPVMLRHNDATELCITKGQEGTVAGWQSCIGPHGKSVLDTLFVRLTKPPQNIKFDGLPENIVPISRNVQTIDCSMKSDTVRRVDREQCAVLPNFSMTDYGSQGKSRPYNPVDLEHSTSHQSYYTCLSRSATAEGTLIMHSFQPSVITGGCSGWLRQEFRELEMLDQITKLAYDDILPKEIDGHRRNTIIHQYRTWKGLMYMSDNIHPALRWSQKNPYSIQTQTLDSPWTIVDRKQKTKETFTQKPDLIPNKFVVAKGSLPLHSKPMKVQYLKRKSEIADIYEYQPTKKIKSTHDLTPIVLSSKKRKHNDELSIPRKKIKTVNTEINQTPPGTQWDGENYSCAYDALFTILYDIWSSKPTQWKTFFKDSNPYLTALHDGFYKYHVGTDSLESARDYVRNLLYTDDSILFPSGHEGTSVTALATQILHPISKIPKLHLCCSQCNHKLEINSNRIHRVTYIADNAIESTADILANYMHHHRNLTCVQCNAPLETSIHFNEPHKIYAFDMTSGHARLSHTVKIQGNARSTVLHLRGLIYLGGFHYTCRIIDHSGNIWFHDGMTTGNKCNAEGKMGSISQPNLYVCGNKNLCLAIYAKKT